MIAQQDVITTLKELNLVKYYKQNYCLRDRATLNKAVKLKYKVPVSCEF